MRRRIVEEWLILSLFAAFTTVFAWYTKDGQRFELVFILPLVIFIGILWIIVALGVAKKSLVPPSKNNNGGTSGEREADASWGKSAGFAIMVALLLVGLSTVGFFTSLFLFLICAMWVLGVRQWKTLLAVPAVLIGAIYVVFVQILGVPISASPLGLY